MTFWGFWRVITGFRGFFKGNFGFSGFFKGNFGFSGFFKGFFKGGFKLCREPAGICVGSETSHMSSS